MYYYELSLTVLVERCDQIVSDQLRGTAFYLVAFDHVHQFAILEQGDSGRRGRIREQVLTYLINGLYIKAGKARGQIVGFFPAVGYGHQNPGTCHACCATADGVDDNQCGSGLMQLIIYFCGGQQFLKTVIGQFLLHRLDYFLWIHCFSVILYN
jgi:hypothetical protein